MTAQSEQNKTDRSEDRLSGHKALHDELTNVLDTVNAYYRQSDYKAESNLDTCIRLAYRMALEYFLSSTCLVRVSEVELSLSAAPLVRSLLEVVADVRHITSDRSKMERRATDYKESVDAYFTAMHQQALNLANGDTYSMSSLNSWTDSTITDRVKALGDDTMEMYGFYSSFTHANPGYHVYLAEPQLGQQLRSAVYKSALVYMVDLLRVMAIHATGPGLNPQQVEDINKSLTKLN